MDKKELAKLLDEYQDLFIKTYEDIVSKKYSQHVYKFPLNKGYNVRVVFINDNEAVEIIFILNNTPGMISSSYCNFELEKTENKSVENLIKENEESHKKKVINVLDLKDVIGHIIIFPPFKDQEQLIKEQAEKIVEEHYKVISDVGLPYDKIEKFPDGGKIISDLDEIKKCMLHKLFRPAISSIAVAMENAFIIRLLKEGKDIREEERNGINWFLPGLNKETYEEAKLITDKTFDRINILNKIRRFGTHSKTGATLEDDASFVFNCYKQALIEMFS